MKFNEHQKWWKFFWIGFDLNQKLKCFSEKPKMQTDDPLSKNEPDFTILWSKKYDSSYIEVQPKNMMTVFLGFDWPLEIDECCRHSQVFRSCSGVR